MVNGHVNNRGVLPCPFCGDIPKVEICTHNSVKADSWYICTSIGWVS